MSEAKFLHTVADKLENSPSRYDYDHNEGELFIVNNKFWVHGRRKILAKLTLIENYYEYVAIFVSSKVDKMQLNIHDQIKLETQKLKN